MHTDDVLVTRGARWHRRVMALNFDALLRWALVANVATVTVFSLLGIVAFALGLASRVAGCLGY